MEAAYRYSSPAAVDTLLGCVDQRSGIELLRLDVVRPFQIGAAARNRLGDVDEDLAGQRIAIVRDHLNRAGVQDGDDDDVAQDDRVPMACRDVLQLPYVRS